MSGYPRNPDRKAWSPEEDKILREIVDSGRNIIDCTHMLPGRSLGAIYHRNTTAHCRDVLPKDNYALGPLERELMAKQSRWLDRHTGARRP